MLHDAVGFNVDVRVKKTHAHYFWKYVSVYIHIIFFEAGIYIGISEIT